MLADLGQPAAEGGEQVLVLLLEGGVALERRGVQVTRRRWVGHEDELDLAVGLRVAQAEQERVGGQVQPAGRGEGAELADGRGGQAHGVAEGLTEVLVVVVAGQGQDGAAATQEVVEDALQVRDGVAQAVGGVRGQLVR